MRRIEELLYGFRGCRRGFQGAVGGVLDFFVNLLLQAVDSLFVQNAFAQQKHLHTGDGVPLGVTLALNIRAIKTLVVGERVRIRPDYMRKDETGPIAGPAMRCRALERSVARDGVSTVDFFEMEIGKALHQAGYAAARG